MPFHFRKKRAAPQPARFAALLNCERLRLDFLMPVPSSAPSAAIAPLADAPRADAPRGFSRLGRWLILGLVFAGVLLLSCASGAVRFWDVWSNDSDTARIAQQILWQIRLPRVVCGVLVGAGLAGAGSALQATFRNPLAEPYLLGVSAGGALGATVATALRLPSFAAQSRISWLSFFDAPSVCAFGGALSASALVYVLGQKRASVSSGSNRDTLLLTGVALSALLSALMMLVVTLSDNIELATQTAFWMLGGLTRASWPQNAVLLGADVLGMSLLLASARDLNALRAGDEEAQSLGVEVGSLHRRLLFASALMSAAAVAAAGLIGFVGLLAPHLMRRVFGSDARVAIPAAALGGALLLCACDLIARMARPPIEIPVGIVTALLGVPLFFFLARGNGRV